MIFVLRFVYVCICYLFFFVCLIYCLLFLLCFKYPNKMKLLYINSCYINCNCYFLFSAKSTLPALTFDKEAAHQGITCFLCPVERLKPTGYRWTIKAGMINNLLFCFVNFFLYVRFIVYYFYYVSNIPIK